MRISFFVFCIFMIFSCSQSQPKVEKKVSEQQSNPMENNVEDENQITCWGIGQVELGDDMQALEEKLGKKNLELDSLMPEGTFDGFLSTIWKGSDKEIKVIWKEKKAPFKTIKYLEISNDKSPYHFANGIKVGVSLRDVEKANDNKPFKLYGFGWDNGGSIVSFGNGRLAGDLPCFKGVFRLTDSELAGNELTAILGDQVISSDHPSLKKYKAELAIIRIENTD